MRTWSKAVLLSGVVVMWSACLIERPQVPKPECSVNSECPTGKICGGAGRCVDACSQDTDCQAPLTCTSGACVAPAGRCARDADCSDGKTCANTFCATPCTDATACAAGESCVSGACLVVSAPAGCRYDSECGAGEACVQGRCGARCLADTDCAAPLSCAQGACVPPSGRCVVDGNCAGTEACVATVCAPRCTDAAGCGPNQACLNGACATLASGTCRYTSECANGQACIQGRCAAACLATADCAPGTECRGGLCQVLAAGCFASAQCDAGLACAPSGSCVAACATDGDCTAQGQVCSNGACVTSGPTTTTITGQVTLTGVPDGGSFPVTVKGPNRLTGATRADGTFSFAGLLPGLYDVSVSVPATTEGSLTREVAALAGASATAGPFAFSPVGSVRGQVTLQGRATHEGIGISALGTSRGTVTDPTGAFTLTGLPPGSYDLLATAPGYQAGQFQGVVVTWQGVTQASPALQLAPVPAGSTFAFSSLPPTSVRQYRPFVYTAVAGGGGVGAVTYVLEAGPTGMTLNPSTGQVSWAPTTTGRPWVAISARGGSQVIYQYFEVDVLAAYEQLTFNANEDLEATDAGVWVVEDEAVLHLLPDGGQRRTDAPPAQSGTVTAVELLNGGTVTAVRAHAGTVTSIQMPAGIASATWEGGLIDSVSSDAGLTVSASRLTGGQVASIAFPGADRVQSLSYPTGTPTSVTPVTWPLTAVRARTGLVGTVSGNTLTDPSANWAAGELTSTLCVSDATASFKVPVASHTATSITVTASPALDTRLAVGERYFVILCSAAANNLQYVVESSGASFGSLTSPAHALAMYARSTYLAAYAVTANTATTVTFLAPLSRWAEFTALTGTQGFFTVGPGNTGNATSDVRLVDPAAAFAAGLASTSRITFEGFTPTYAIASNTGTEVVFRIPFDEALTLPLGGRKWILTNTSNQVLVTVTPVAGNLPAGITDRLWVDSVGVFYAVTANTTSTVTVAAPLSAVPYTSWANSELAWGPTSAILPTTVVTDAAGGLTPGAHVGRMLQRLVGTNDIQRERPIAANDASTLTLTTGGSCSFLAGASCVGAMGKLRLAFASARWLTGTDAVPQQGDVVFTLSGSPNLTPGAWVGATAQLPSGHWATVLANGPSELTLSIEEGDLPAVLALAAPYGLILSGTGTGEPLVKLLRVAGAAWAANQWVGYRVVAPNGVVAGRVFSNSADTVEVESLMTSATERTASSLLLPGAAFAFAGAYPEGISCSGGYSVRARVNLAGATLTATAGTLRFQNNYGIALRAYQADATGGNVSVCPADFDVLLAGRGQVGLLTTDGLGAFTLIDSNAAWTPGEMTGLTRLRMGLPSTSVLTSGQLITNTAQAVQLTGMNTYTFFVTFLPTFLVTGATYEVLDDNSTILTRLTTTQTLTPSSLKGRGVRSVRASDGDTVTYWVLDNDAQSITLRASSSQVQNFRASAGTLQYRYLLTSWGQVARLTVGGAALTPGALVGENIDVGSTDGHVIANTANTITVTNDDSSPAQDARFVARVMAATDWVTHQHVGYSGLAPLPGGGVMTASWAWFGESGLFEVHPDGSTVNRNPFNTGRSFQVTPVLGLSGRAPRPTSLDGFTTLSDPAWSLAPGSLAGQTLVIFDCGTPTHRQIVANTATSITLRGATSCPVAQVDVGYFVQTWRLRVSGATLVADELAGRTVAINGAQYLVRSNTSTEVQLVPPALATTSGGAAFGEPASEGGATMVELGAFPLANTVALEALPSGYAFASSNFISRRDGAQVRTWDTLSTATLVTPVTVTDALPNNAFRVTPATLTPGALVGKVLQANGVGFVITANTADTVTLTLSAVLAAPLPGATYRVAEDDGLTNITGLAADGAVLWVTASRGLYKHDGTAWTHYTVQNTESAAGAGDGLLSNTPSGVSVTGPGEVWVTDFSQGVSRFVGGQWTRFTEASTESAAGLADGLGSDTVYAVTKDAAGAYWFGRSLGVSRLLGTSWQQHFGFPDSPSSILKVVTAPWGDRYFVTSSRAYRVVP